MWVFLFKVYIILINELGDLIVYINVENWINCMYRIVNYLMLSWYLKVEVLFVFYNLLIV